MGTDFSVALFYSGDIEAAQAQIDEVLEANPDFQKGWLNKGIFISHEPRMMGQADTEQADKLFRQAKTAFTKAVAIDPQSDAGKQADQSLQALSQRAANGRGRRAGTPAAGRGALNTRRGRSARSERHTASREQYSLAQATSAASSGAGRSRRAPADTRGRAPPSHLGRLALLALLVISATAFYVSPLRAFFAGKDEYARRPGRAPGGPARTTPR